MMAYYVSWKTDFLNMQKIAIHAASNRSTFIHCNQFVFLFLMVTSQARLE